MDFLFQERETDTSEELSSQLSLRAILGWDESLLCHFFPRPWSLCLKRENNVEILTFHLLIGNQWSSFSQNICVKIKPPLCSIQTELMLIKEKIIIESVELFLDLLAFELKYCMVINFQYLTQGLTYLGENCSALKT